MAAGILGSPTSYHATMTNHVPPSQLKVVASFLVVRQTRTDIVYIGEAEGDIIIMPNNFLGAGADVSSNLPTDELCRGNKRQVASFWDNFVSTVFFLAVL